MVGIFYESNVYADYRPKSGHYSVRESIKGADRIESVTELAIKKLKIKASEDAGGYVLRDEKLADGKYSEQVQVLSGALVEISNVKSRLETNHDGVGELVVEADTTVDLSSLERRVHSIKENAQLRVLLDRKNKEYLDAINRKDYSRVYTVEKEYLRALPETEVSELQYLAKLSEALLGRFRTAIIDINSELPKHFYLTTAGNEIYVNKDSAYLSTTYGAKIDYEGFNTFLSEFGRTYDASFRGATCIEVNEGVRSTDYKKMLAELKRFKRYNNIYAHVDFELNYSDGSTMIVRGTVPYPLVNEPSSSEEPCRPTSSATSMPEYVLFSTLPPEYRVRYYLPIERKYLKDLKSIKSTAQLGSLNEEPKKGTRIKYRFINGQESSFEDSNVGLLLSVDATKWTGDN